MIQFFYIRFQCCWDGSLLGDKPEVAIIFEDVCLIFSYLYDIIRGNLFCFF